MSSRVCSPSPKQDEIRAAFQVFLEVIGGIRTRHDHDGALAPGQLDHPVGGVTHIGQTHLGEVVEAIVINDEEIRPLGGQPGNYLIGAFHEHRIEKGDGHPRLSQEGGGSDGGQRRIWGTISPLFGVIPHEIRMRK
jgi:hypothetical protein